MGDTWAGGEPPEGAYSRVSRDLAAVTAGFASYLDGLGVSLGEYDCLVREPYDDELARIRAGGPVDSCVVIEPTSGGGAELLVGRSSFDGGVSARMVLGVAVDESLPTCFCDACDEDSESLVDQVEELVQLVVRGFREYRRPHVADPGELLFRGPWMEHGCESGDISASRAGHDVRGEAFSVDWPAWVRRTT